MTTPPIDRGSPQTAVGEWYVTAHTVHKRLVDGRLIELPGSVAHAKRMGTPVTACGTWADTWRKILDLPFPLPLRWAYLLESCPDCYDVVAAERRP